ncbi:MAG: (Fe-S)-binding protein [Anaerolineae bacterium]|nr:(Fe-S)-binding protein [Anaerolineae bacterium]
MSSLLERTIPGQQVTGPELPDYDQLQRCIHCGRCLPVCPTYQETLLEMMSPRGRLALLRAVEDGKIGLTAQIADYLYSCLDCRACNVVCPAEVPIGELILQGRAAYAEQVGRPWWGRLILDRFLSSARALEPVMKLARLYQRLGLPHVARPLLRALKDRHSIFQVLYHMEGLLPKLPDRPLHVRLEEITPARGQRRYRVGFFLGCMMSQVLADASQATIRVLTRNGCEVVTPHDQVCCGAPHEDQGNKRKARELARRNIDVFSRYHDLDVIVTDCAACAGMLKEYPHLLRDDPEYYPRAVAMAHRVRDISEWLAEIIDDSTPIGEVPRAVTYHEPCHLANVQGIREQPVQVLRKIPGLELRPLRDSTRCCGSAGIYNLTHPEMSNRLLADKIQKIAETGADTVVTGNPGCVLQIQMGLREHGVPVRVRHLTQVLDEAYEHAQSQPPADANEEWVIHANSRTDPN